MLAILKRFSKIKKLCRNFNQAGKMIPLKCRFIDQIFLFKHIHIPAHHTRKTHSLPSHLIHLITEGDYELTIQGRQYHPKVKDIIYYDEMEEVIWLNNKTPVSFYTLAFSSNYFKPLTIEKRVFASTSKMRKLFSELDNIQQKHPIMADLKFYQTALNLLGDIFGENDATIQEKDFNAWQKAEVYLQRNHIYQIRLEALSKALNTSTATLRRDCHKVYHSSPVQRLKVRRMEAAKGLLVFTHLPITEIAAQLQYERVHEFSREFSSHLKKSAKQYREENNPKKTQPLPESKKK